MKFPISHNVFHTNMRAVCLLLFVLLLTARPAFSGGSELTNLIVRNHNDELQVDLLIKGIFTDEMKATVVKGIPLCLRFLIFLYEVRDHWFDEKIISKTAKHVVKFDILRKEYRVWRLWEKRNPSIIQDFDETQNVFSEIKRFDLIPLKRLKKGKHYQLRVKLELNEEKYPFTGFPWGFETDWYTLNFIF